MLCAAHPEFLWRMSAFRNWGKIKLPRSGRVIGSAYWGAPAAHTHAVEVVGAAESDLKRHCRLRLDLFSL